MTVKEHQCGWGDNAVPLLCSHLFSFLPGPTASILPYVNVTMLPYRPHNIHLLVEMTASAPLCIDPVPRLKRGQEARCSSRKRYFGFGLLKRSGRTSVSDSNGLVEAESGGG